MNKREKIKAHVRENKGIYIASGVSLVVGAAGAAIVLGRTNGVSINPKQILTWNSTQTVEVFIEALGDPGNIIQDTTTGIVYASQGQAARALGLSPARISEYFAGKRDHVNGHMFERLGKAAVTQE